MRGSPNRGLRDSRKSAGHTTTLMQSRYFEDLRDTMDGRYELSLDRRGADEAVAKGCLSPTVVKERQPTQRSKNTGKGRCRMMSSRA